MKKIYTTIILVSISLLFNFCTKNYSTNGGKYFFKYNIEGKNGGYEGEDGIIPGLTTNGTYFAISGSSGILLASRESDCNVNGSPPCFSALLSVNSLSKGINNLSTYGNVFVLTENVNSVNSKRYWVSFSDGVGNGQITLTEVGSVGGIVSGSFSVQAGLEDYYGNISSKTIPITGSFRLLRTK